MTKAEQDTIKEASEKFSQLDEAARLQVQGFIAALTMMAAAQQPRQEQTVAS